MNADLAKPGKDYWDTVVTSPFGNELLLEFAIHALDAENLGHNEVPDFSASAFPATT